MADGETASSATAPSGDGQSAPVWSGQVTQAKAFGSIQWLSQLLREQKPLLKDELVSPLVATIQTVEQLLMDIDNLQPNILEAVFILSSDVRSSLEQAAAYAASGRFLQSRAAANRALACREQLQHLVIPTMNAHASEILPSKELLKKSLKPSGLQFWTASFGDSGENVSWFSFEYAFRVTCASANVQLLPRDFMLVKRFLDGDNDNHVSVADFAAMCQMDKSDEEGGGFAESVVEILSARDAEAPEMRAEIDEECRLMLEEDVFRLREENARYAAEFEKWLEAQREAARSAAEELAPRVRELLVERIEAKRKDVQVDLERRRRLEQHKKAALESIGVSWQVSAARESAPLFGRSNKEVQAEFELEKTEKIVHRTACSYLLRDNSVPVSGHLFLTTSYLCFRSPHLHGATKTIKIAVEDITGIRYSPLLSSSASSPAPVSSIQHGSVNQFLSSNQQFYHDKSRFTFPSAPPPRCIDVHVIGGGNYSSMSFKLSGMPSSDVTFALIQGRRREVAGIEDRPLLREGFLRSKGKLLFVRLFQDKLIGYADDSSPDIEINISTMTMSCVTAVDGEDAVFCLFVGPHEHMFECEASSGSDSSSFASRDAWIADLKCIIQPPNMACEFFDVLKQNERGKFQARILELDVIKKELNNIKLNSKSSRRSFRLANIQRTVRDPVNALHIKITFRKRKNIYDLFFASPERASTFYRLIENRDDLPSLTASPERVVPAQTRSFFGNSPRLLLLMKSHVLVLEHDVHARPSLLMPLESLVTGAVDELGVQFFTSSEGSPLALTLYFYCATERDEFLRSILIAKEALSRSIGAAGRPLSSLDRRPSTIPTPSLRFASEADVVSGVSSSKSKGATAGADSSSLPPPIETGLFSFPDLTGEAMVGGLQALNRDQEQQQQKEQQKPKIAILPDVLDPIQQPAAAAPAAASASYGDIREDIPAAELGPALIMSSLHAALQNLSIDNASAVASPPDSHRVERPMTPYQGNNAGVSSPPAPAASVAASPAASVSPPPPQQIPLKTRLNETQYKVNILAMQKGAYFMKYPHGSGRAHRRFLYLTNDLKFISWKDDEASRKETHLELATVAKIVSGRTTAAFRNSGAAGKEEAAKAKRSFSLIASTRTLDLEAESEYDFELWLSSLKQLLDK